MSVSELLNKDFALRDGLKGAQVLALEEVRATLELQGSETAPQSEQATEGTSELLGRALELFEATEYDVQAWVMLVRVLAEAGTAGGAFLALQLVHKGLGKPWEELERAAEHTAEPGKGAARLGRHVDALMGRLYESLAYAQEREPPRLQRALEGEGEAWSVLLDAVEQSLSERKLAGANWDSLNRLIQSAVSARDRAEADLTTAHAPSAGTDLEQEPTAAPSDPTGTEMEPATDAAAVHSDHVALRVSKEFFELRRRLEAFQILVGRHDFEKAALVASELSECLNQFDVTSFFPDLFASLFEGQIKYAAELEPFSTRGDGMRERSLRQLYRTALDRFLAEGLTSGDHGR